MAKKNPQELSRQLREEDSPSLGRRRRIVGLALAGAASMGLISLYQTGILKGLPEPPLPGLDTKKVVGSGEAYAKLSTPDALLGLASYSVTAVLAGMGGEDRAGEHPAIPLAMAGKVAFDAANAAKLTWDQWSRHGAFCVWCMLAAGATFAMLPPALGEAREALRRRRDAGSAARPGQAEDRAPAKGAYERPAGRARMNVVPDTMGPGGEVTP